jgi:hypothetical protein
VTPLRQRMLQELQRRNYSPLSGDPNSIEPAAVARRTSGFLQTALSDLLRPSLILTTCSCFAGQLR